jgi:hypothetical protein
MIEQYSSKLSITADTAFQKDLTLQGCPNVPTCLINPLGKSRALNKNGCTIRIVTTRTLLHYKQVQEATWLSLTRIESPAESLNGPSCLHRCCKMDRSLSSGEVVHLQSSRAYTSMQNKGLQGSLGFPQNKSDQKIQAARPTRTKWKHLELVVATGQVCRFRQWSREARKRTHVWLERSVSEQFMRSRGPRGHNWAIVKLAKMTHRCLCLIQF